MYVHVPNIPKIPYLPALRDSFSTGLGKLSGRAPTESPPSSIRGSPAKSGVLKTQNKPLGKQ